MNSSEEYVSSPVACHLPKLIAAERIGCVDTDAYNIAGLNAGWIDGS